jgi:hypothetical protein
MVPKKSHQLRLSNFANSHFGSRANWRKSEWVNARETLSSEQDGRASVSRGFKLERMLPTRLYKYLPKVYLRSVINSGNLPFRSLSYYQSVEDKERGDPCEAMHIDRPTSGLTLSVPKKGIRMTGDFAFINRVQSDQIYCFCLSSRKEEAFFEQFGCDTCIEILDVPEFLRRCKRAVTSLRSSTDWEFIHRNIEYFRVDVAASLDIKDPRNLPFFKLDKYIHQGEYRLVAARTGAFKLIQEIVNFDAGHDFSAEAKTMVARKINFQLGSLRDITSVHFAHAAKT